jgi:ABC-type branched-subunit amino acid transport system ATPase component
MLSATRRSAHRGIEPAPVNYVMDATAAFVQVGVSSAFAPAPPLDAGRGRCIARALATDPEVLLMFEPRPGAVAERLA